MGNASNLNRRLLLKKHVPPDDGVQVKWVHPTNRPHACEQASPVVRASPMSPADGQSQPNAKNASADCSKETADVDVTTARRRASGRSARATRPPRLPMGSWCGGAGGEGKMVG